ncbi:MAG: prepilin-type N-terminal cleavage/methylation domain-containing protein [Terrimicrobiaceae bacterium]
MTIKRQQGTKPAGSASEFRSPQGIKHFARFTRCGFSLMEMLIAVAVISALAALLFPAMGRAKEKAMGAACQAHLQQLGAATQMYLADHDNVMLRQCSGDSDPAMPPWSGWFNYLQPYLGEKAKSRDSLFCPSAIRTLPDPAYTGYGFNGNLDALKVTRLQAFSTVPIAWDDVQKDEAIGYDNHYGGWPTADWAGGGSWYKLAFRHGGMCNLLFLDGHVTPVKKGARNTAEDYPEYEWGPFP